VYLLNAEKYKIGKKKGIKQQKEKQIKNIRVDWQIHWEDRLLDEKSIRWSTA